MSRKRTEAKDRPTWDETFFAMARLVAEQSTCPDGARHGAVAVRDGRVLALGYGSPAAGVEPCPVCWLRKKAAETGEKDWSVCPSVHAEANVVANAARVGVSLLGATVYVTRRPCEACSRLLLNAGAGATWEQ